MVYAAKVAARRDLGLRLLRATSRVHQRSPCVRQGAKPASGKEEGTHGTLEVGSETWLPIYYLTRFMIALRIRDLCAVRGHAIEVESPISVREGAGGEGGVGVEYAPRRRRAGGAEVGGGRSVIAQEALGGGAGAALHVVLLLVDPLGDRVDVGVRKGLARHGVEEGGAYL